MKRDPQELRLELGCGVHSNKHPDPATGPSDHLRKIEQDQAKSSYMVTIFSTCRSNGPLGRGTDNDSILLWKMIQKWFGVVNESVFTLGGAAKAWLLVPRLARVKVDGSSPSLSKRHYR